VIITVAVIVAADVAVDGGGAVAVGDAVAVADAVEVRVTVRILLSDVGLARAVVERVGNLVAVGIGGDREQRLLPAGKRAGVAT
jgi:hypothetical protein